MLYPKVVGQSGTARPAPLLVTRPPIKSKGNVAQARMTASRWGQTLTSPEFYAGRLAADMELH